MFILFILHFRFSRKLRENFLNLPNFSEQIFAKAKINFRDNAKTKIFVSTLIGTVDNYWKRETSNRQEQVGMVKKRFL
jgi:hypothetical protein